MKTILSSFKEASAAKLKSETAEKLHRLHTVGFNSDPDEVVEILNSLSKEEMDYIEDIDPSFFAALDSIMASTLQSEM